MGQDRGHQTCEKAGAADGGPLRGQEEACKASVPGCEHCLGSQPTSTPGWRLATPPQNDVHPRSIAVRHSERVENLAMITVREK